MPLRDHFRKTSVRSRLGESVLGGWPMALAMRLQPILPPEYVAAPKVRLGVDYEVDVGAWEHSSRDADVRNDEGGGVAVATWSPPKPTALIDADLGEFDELELQFFEIEGDRLLAAIEFVSPGNKDRPAAREAFVAKVIALLRQEVCVTIVDIVTDRRANLYLETLDGLGVSDPSISSDPPALSAVTCRRTGTSRRGKMETWFSPLAIGQPLPTLPCWLSPDLAIPLPLEESYEDVCRVLRMGPA